MRVSSFSSSRATTPTCEVSGVGRSSGAVDTRLKYERVRTRTGVNLHGKLDPRWVDEALRLAEELAAVQFTQEAITTCHQILAVCSEHEGAQQLLSRLGALSE